MKIVTINMELVIDEDVKDSFIPQYLNDKLYSDPEFFGDFGPENILEIKKHRIHRFCNEHSQYGG